MEYIKAGQLIRELRKRKGLSQEQLCEGLCEPPTMSKIEKGRQYPNRKLLDALLVRLQEHVELQVPLSSADFERAQLEREVISRVANGNHDILELASRYRECAASMNSYEQQFYLFAQAVHLTDAEKKWGAALELFEDAIRLTLPAYVSGSDITLTMFTSMEFTILNNIAICQWFLQRKKEAVALMEQLYNILNSYDMDMEEYARRLPPVAYNLSMWLGLQKDYEKSLDVAERGIECSVKYGKYASLADLLYNKGFTLLCLGRTEEGKEVLRKAFMLMYACDSSSSYPVFKDDMEKAFGKDLWAEVKDIALPDGLCHCSSHLTCSSA